MKAVAAPAGSCLCTPRTDCQDAECKAGPRDDIDAHRQFHVISQHFLAALELLLTLSVMSGHRQMILRTSCSPVLGTFVS